HSIPNYAYAFVENEKPGRFHPKKAEALGVPRGPLWRRLQWGKPVKLKDGRVIRAEDIVEPMRPGVKIVYSGDTKPSRRMIAFAEKADVLIHDCTFDDDLIETAAAERHGTPSLTATIAREAGVKLLILTHVSARYQSTARIRKHAAEIFPNVVIAKDLMRLQV
ncbi:MAG: MBL fold metallo-hydrolase, partial [Candidatus Bathyarchaeia archaeon]